MQTVVKYRHRVKLNLNEKYSPGKNQAGKARVKTMKIEEILQELDNLFAQHEVEAVEYFLENHIRQALLAGDTDTAISLMNEMIGYCRDTGKFDKGLSYCQEVVKLMQSLGMAGSIPFATTLLNVANFCRAAGLLQESMEYYKAVFALYEGRLAPEDMRYAGLYNNMSLLYQEMEDYEKACTCLENALAIVMQHGDTRIETAVTFVNLANSKLKLGRVKEAEADLEKAFALFDMDEERDFHYGAALSAMAEAKYMEGALQEAAYYYQEALKEIKKNTGESKSYQIIRQNLHQVLAQLEQGGVAGVQEKETAPSVIKQYEKGMQLCEDFYKEYGIPMIRTRFPEYEKVIAVGLVGEGSECFGFDDAVSRDHDFGPGFCMWLTEQVYDEIGEKLQEAYDKLPKTYMGVTRYETPKAAKRVGVFRIKDFYEHLTGQPDIPTTQNQWLFIEDYQFAAATNGKVFRDDLGEFSRIRAGLLKHYPREACVKKIAREAALMAQSGQYNYSRMAGRGDMVTAQIALAEFMKHTMFMMYLLNRKYAPFYKWMFKGTENLPLLQPVRELLDMLACLHIGDDRIPRIIEKIVALVIAEMKKQGLTTGDDTYLDHHTDNILKSIPQKDKEEPTIKSELVNALVKLEWEAFDQVQNEGGRADCQDDWNTFSIMRKSQYYTWTEEMLRSYIHDFHKAGENGWNLITEKYGRMMESTDPVGYARIKGNLPVIPEAKQEIIEAIAAIQVGWMEAFAAEYPKAASCARSIHTAEDNLFNTSYETYLRGELGTYSDETLDLYGRFVAGILQEGGNLAQMIMANTAFLYGYGSLEELEERL